MSYEVWSKSHWNVSNAKAYETTATYDMALIKAKIFSKNICTGAVVVVEKKSPAPVKVRAIFIDGKMMDPVNCKHCSGSGNTACPCKGAGWNPIRN